MKIGVMTFVRGEDGQWLYATIQQAQLLDYIESHGLDRAGEKIAKLSRMCESYERIIEDTRRALAEEKSEASRDATEYIQKQSALRQAYEDTKRNLAMMIRENERLTDTVVYESKIQGPDSYKQRFIDEAAIRIFASGEPVTAAWSLALELWDTRIIE
jgi:hypothetical protein